MPDKRARKMMRCYCHEERRECIETGPGTWFCIESLKEMGMGEVIWRRCPFRRRPTRLEGTAFYECGCDSWDVPHIYLSTFKHGEGPEPFECGPIFSEERAHEWLKVSRVMWMDETTHARVMAQLSQFSLPKRKTPEDHEVERGMDDYGFG